MNFDIDYDFIGLSEIEKLKGLAEFQFEKSIIKPEISIEFKKPEKEKNKINVVSYAVRESKSKLF